jgi:putative membrane protein
MMGSFGMGFMWIIWIVIIVAVVLLAKDYFRPAEKVTGSMGDTAVEVLKRRYARGEISKEEFEEKKRDLV